VSLLPASPFAPSGGILAIADPPARQRLHLNDQLKGVYPGEFWIIDFAPVDKAADVLREELGLAEEMPGG